MHSCREHIIAVAVGSGFCVDTLMGSRKQRRSTLQVGAQLLDSAAAEELKGRDGGGPLVLQGRQELPHRALAAQVGPDAAQLTHALHLGRRTAVPGRKMCLSGRLMGQIYINLHVYGNNAIY